MAIPLTTSDRYPAWVQEIVTLLSVCSQFVLSGNTSDLYFASSAPLDRNKADLTVLPALVDRALKEAGIRAVLAYEPTDGVRIAVEDDSDPEVARLFENPVEDLARPNDLSSLADLIDAVISSEEPTALIVESASRLIRQPDRLSESEFGFFRRVDRICRQAVPTTSNGHTVHSCVIWVVDSDQDLPHWYSLRNDSLRSISIPLPDSGEREEMARRRLDSLAICRDQDMDEKELARSVRILREQSAGFGLNAVRNMVMLADEQQIPIGQIEDAARSYLVGVLQNPWRADFITKRLREELAGVKADDERPLLTEQVLGQPEAVAKALDILCRSAAGLTAAHAGRSATRPRGVLFFAGPTGVGKTQLAKAITKLLFDDERFYIRFDMSESRASIQRIA